MGIHQCIITLVGLLVVLIFASPLVVKTEVTTFQSILPTLTVSAFSYDGSALTPSIISSIEKNTSLHHQITARRRKHSSFSRAPTPSTDGAYEWDDLPGRKFWGFSSAAVNPSVVVKEPKPPRYSETVKSHPHDCHRRMNHIKAIVWYEKPELTACWKKAQELYPQFLCIYTGHHRCYNDVQMRHRFDKAMEEWGFKDVDLDYEWDFASKSEWDWKRAVNYQGQCRGCLKKMAGKKGPYEGDECKGCFKWWFLGTPSKEDQ